jgi:tRNA-dihydrouridine synthase 2
VADLLGSGTGEEEFREIERAIALRPNRYHRFVNLTAETRDQGRDEEEQQAPISTPPERENPEPPTLNAPRGPTHPLRMTIPAGVSGHDAMTPTPGGGVTLAA